MADVAAAQPRISVEEFRSFQALLDAMAAARPCPTEEESLAFQALAEGWQVLRAAWQQPPPHPSCPSSATPLPPVLSPGALCEACFDAMATQEQAAPWGGLMGVCAACAA